MDIENQKKIVFEDLHSTASKIGEHTRYIGFGIIAICFAIITVHYEPTSKLYTVPIHFILAATVFAILALVFDYLQCLMGYLSSLKAYKNEKNGYQYNRNWQSYRFRGYFFTLKQMFAISGALILIVGIATIF